MSPWWAERIAALEVAFADGIPAGFMDHPAVLDCGVTTNDPAGYELAPFAVNTTDAAHWSHIIAAGANGDDVSTIVEFGGGVGNPARLTRKLSTPPAHVIVDLPVMHRLQRRYLDDAGALNGVMFIDSHPDAIAGLPAPDVFMATFSLDECTTACHDWWFDHDWIGARRVFIAMQRDRGELFPDGPGLAPRLLRAGFAVLPCPYAGAVYLRWDRPTRGT